MAWCAEDQSGGDAQGRYDDVICIMKIFPPERDRGQAWEAFQYLLKPIVTKKFVDVFQRAVRRILDEQEQKKKKLLIGCSSDSPNDAGVEKPYAGAPKIVLNGYNYFVEELQTA